MKLGGILESADKDGGWAVSEMFCLTLPQFSSYHVVLKVCPSFRYVVVRVYLSLSSRLRDLRERAK